jgi:hypothetical protein
MIRGVVTGDMASPAARLVGRRGLPRLKAALVLTALLLAGCGSSPERVADPAPDPLAHPVVAVGQAGTVLDSVESALLTGVDPTATERAATSPAKPADARLIGPFRELALADARIAAERKVKPAAPAKVDRLRLIVPSTKSWPRFFVAVGNTSTSSTPVLRVLASASPRDPYGLWAEALMLPGATLPETAPATTGSALVAPDAGGLVATPKEALSGFAGYLNAGAESTASKQFRRSVFSDQLLQRLAGDRKALKAVATVDSKHTVADPGAIGAAEPLALRTVDGGALVFGELKQDYVITVKKGKGAVAVTDNDLAALAGGQKKIKKTLTRTAVEIVVLHVPPRGKGLITVIAAQKGDVRAVIK